ncbi:NAD(P)-dependent oxidoreductase [Synechococcus sp. LTW-R]|uniref:NAD-dependent epimerase/dehydratase family protein n=1 Tax=Synechococcus sp. LTW-R TaxID=2751170 RepID=UPI0016296F3C|nr:SDR family oxidoreductase [Synechococcus sp. LTW-R]QNG28966.1 SDR family oxidoreductase [Synechococcus sp. LTW-R]
MAVALVGPTSYIAERLASALDEAGKNYHLISLRNKGEAEYKTRRSVTSKDELTVDMIKDLGIDSAILCASMSAGECEQNPDKAHYINTEQVVATVDALARGGTKRFMYLSTIKVYGEGLEGRITERTNAAPTTIYGKTHYNTEVTLRRLASQRGIEVLMVRMSNVFGPPVTNKDSVWSLAANCFARQMASKGLIDVRSPKVMRNILPMEKLINFITAWLERGINAHRVEVVNLGSSTTLSMKSLAELIQECYCGRLGVDDIRSVANTEKAAFQFSTDHSSGLMSIARADDEEVVLFEMKRLCDTSRKLFG